MDERSTLKTAPPSAGEQAELELRSHFQGRRHGQRLKVALRVELVCLKRNLAARTINISSSGALLEVLDQGELGMAELMRFCEEIGQLFAAGKHEQQRRPSVTFARPSEECSHVVRSSPRMLGK